MTDKGLFLYCRTGFENDCAAEIQDKAAVGGVAGFCKAKAGSGYVVFQAYEAGGIDTFLEQLPFASLVFTRQWFVITATCTSLDPEDRLAGLLPALKLAPGPCVGVFVDTVDTNEGRELTALCRALYRPLVQALEVTNMIAAKSDWRLHVCMLSGVAAYVGFSSVVNSSPWSQGIPRLKFPSRAPSRSTLKLDEALLLFLDEEQRQQWLRPGLVAVDLGAAPGGWTWQLVKRGLWVVAVDNGAMDSALLDSGLVEHRREDGFHFRPSQSVEWLVCDMVERPIRIAELVGRWFEQGWCRHAVFNLKLPMKKRYQEVQRCLQLLEAVLARRGSAYRLGCKQLYHDREEVTVFVSVA